MVQGTVVTSEATEEKIPNLKHQNTNKSQNPIFNDQNIHRNGCANPGLPMVISVDTTTEGPIVWNFEFGTLGFV